MPSPPHIAAPPDKAKKKKKKMFPPEKRVVNQNDVNISWMT